MTASPAGVLRVLLEGLVDYAGLFPPASLDLPTVVGNYAAYRRAQRAWMLGRLVVPASRLDDLAGVAAPWWSSDGCGAPWHVAALCGADWHLDLDCVARFNETHGAAGRRPAVVDVAEAKLATAADAGALAERCPPGVRLVCEVAWPDASGTLLDAVQHVGAVAKIRTGGIVADAIPPPGAVRSFLCEAARRGLAFKATAGLHHPVRGRYKLTYDDRAPVAAMHGFLNLFMAAAVAFERADRLREGPAALGEPAATETLVGELLEYEDLHTLRFAEGRCSWGAASVSLDTLGRAREAFALSFGSCSFEEPVDDLRRLGLID